VRRIAGEAGTLLRASVAVATREPGDVLALRAPFGILAPLDGDLLPLESSFCGAALRSAGVLASGGLARDPGASAAERRSGGGPALAAALRGSGVILAVRPAGAAPFHSDDHATLALLAQLVGARASACIRAAAWHRTYDTVFAATGRAVLRVERATGAIVWGGGIEALGGGAWGHSVAAWSMHLAPAQREELARALASGEDARVELALAVAGGRTRCFLLQTFPDPAEPEFVPALLTAIKHERVVPVAELIRAVRHDLNNPLAVVAGTVHLMEASGAAQGTPELARSVRQIRDASDRLRDLSARIGLLERKPEAAFVTEGGGLGVAG
jgi:signal transduction histidine kinase